MNTKLAQELLEKIKADGDYEYVGFRFDERDMKVGECFGNSKHNPDREDERDFPEYGTEEYEAMPELDGTSCYDADYFMSVYANGEMIFFDETKCYLIASNEVGYHDDPDEGEILLKNPIVLGRVL